MVYIHYMNLAKLDLNLLVALDALLAEGGVGRAAQRLNLSQPAVSHALRRLREATGDPLLVRVGPRMELTPHAQALRAPLTQALEQVRGLFQAQGFDPATSTRGFRLMMPDLCVDLLMPAALAEVAAVAPGVRLDVVPWRGPAVLTPDFARTIDLVVAWTGEAYPGFHRQTLYTDRDALAVRRGHPDAGRLSTLAGFNAARHVAVVGAGERDDAIEPFLRQNGVERRIALTAPSYLQALRMTARSDLVAFVPGRLIAALAGPLDLMRVEPPIDPGEDAQYLFHPVVAQKDPGSMWIRDLMLRAGRGL
ncbi:LysR family transcriptional regulator [Caulobacter sp. BK020]|uniref:LysR family transcriptional regulator n=1 Tax=Caulobacter sp. BK020 TaxID=2512117 RepID=UPI001FB2DEA2|nr:LysR family transcriptional regulator [Caulobacter sp. BK020]